MRELSALVIIGVVVMAHMSIGSIQVVHASASGDVAVVEVEVPLGHLAPSSTTGVNKSTMAVTITGTLVPTSTNVVYLNNTNATSPYYARLVSTGTTGLGNIITLEIGIDNGTVQSAQVTASAGTLTSSGGAYIRLEPASSNTLYVTRTVSVLFSVTTVTFDIYVSDDLAESAYVVMTGELTIS